MSIEISQHKYVNMDYKVTEKPGRQKGAFAAHIEAVNSGQDVATEKQRELFRKYMEEMQERIKSGNTGAPSIQTGGAAYTEKEWDKMLSNFDDMEKDIREEMRKEHEERRIKQLEKEQGIKVEPNKIIEEETYPV